MSKPVLSQSKGVNGEYCNRSATIRSWFDKPVLSEVEGLTTKGLNQNFPISFPRDPEALVYFRIALEVLRDGFAGDVLDRER